VSQPTVSLGPDLAMPLLGLGTWQMRGGECRRAVRHAIDAGYRHLDTATMYRNESEIGKAVRESGIPREELFITTKLAPNDAGRERRTLEASLRALGTDYVDLWLIHWPPGGRASAQTWKEFLALRDEGKTQAVGVSNYHVSQIDELTQTSGQTPQVNQIRWGPSLYDAGAVAEHRRRGVVVEGYSPFKTTNLRDPVLTEIAERHGVGPAQVVIRWHIDHEVVVIPKSASPERIAANLDVFGFSLDEADLRRIDGLSSAAR
jgi:2,5-diketo-D-gluconate reductase A